VQFVRKLSGFTQPSRDNAPIFERAVEDTFAVARRLVDNLTTSAPPRDRAVEAVKARERAAKRYGN